jgi:hypothetical protein
MIAGVICVCLASPALAGQQAILIDRSASMRPHYEERLVERLAAGIQRVVQETIYGQDRLALFVFDSEVKALPDADSLRRLRPSGRYTRLDSAIDYPLSRRYSIAWMVTDNIQDEPGSLEAGNTEIFYQRLRSDKVRGVVLFPVSCTPGTPGLVVYALLFSDDDATLYEREIERFPEVVQDLGVIEPLRVKPLNLDTIEVDGTEPSPQARTARRIAAAGQRFEQTVEFRFRSRLEQMRVEDAAVDLSEAKPQLPAGSLLRAEHNEVSISPEVVRGLDPQAQTEVFRLRVDLGRLKLKKDLGSLWKAAFLRSEETVGLSVPVLIHIPREKLKLKPSFNERYGASSVEDARRSGRVYGLERVPLLLSNPTTTVRLQVPLSVRVTYPWWPLTLWGVLLLVGVGGLIGLGLLARKGVTALGRRRRWDVSLELDGRELECRWDGQSVRVPEKDLELGALEGSQFRPGAEVRIVGHPDGPIDVAVERTVCASLRDEAVATLSFRPRGQGARAGKSQANDVPDGDYTPAER